MSLLTGIRFVSKTVQQAQAVAPAAAAASAAPPLGSGQGTTASSREEKASGSRLSEDRKHHKHKHHHHKSRHHHHESSSKKPGSSKGKDRHHTSTKEAKGSEGSESDSDHRSDGSSSSGSRHRGRRREDREQSSWMNPALERRLGRHAQQPFCPSSPEPAHEASADGSSTTVTATATAGAVDAGSRMDWMRAAPSSHVVAHAAAAAQRSTSPQRNSLAAAEAAEASMQREIREGVREPDTGLPYGLYRPSEHIGSNPSDVQKSRFLKPSSGPTTTTVVAGSNASGSSVPAVSCERASPKPDASSVAADTPTAASVGSAASWRDKMLAKKSASVSMALPEAQLAQPEQVTASHATLGLGASTSVDGSAKPGLAWKKPSLPVPVPVGVAGVQTSSMHTGGSSSTQHANGTAAATSSSTSSRAGVTAGGSGASAARITEDPSWGSEGGQALATQESERGSSSSAAAPVAVPAPQLGHSVPVVLTLHQSTEGPVAARAPVMETVIEDLNKLHAQALRAQLMGDTVKYDAIMERVATAQAANAARAESAAALLSQSAGSRPSVLTGGARMSEARARLPPREMPLAKRPRRSSSASSGGEEASNAEIVDYFDARGMPIESLQSGVTAPLERADMRTGRRSGKQTGKINKIDADAPAGTRTAFVREDLEDVSVRELVRREMHSGAADLDSRLAHNVLKAGSRYKGAGFVGSRSGVDEDRDDEVEDIAKLVEDKDAGLTGQARQRKDMQRAVAAHERMQGTLKSCFYCFDSPSIKKHMIISLGDHSMLMLPPDGERIPGQCVIVPIPHVSAMTDADEEVYDEVNVFKGALCKMFQARGEDAIFLETAVFLDKKRHTRIDVIPMEKDIAFDAPLFFRKAILESEEWTSNKQLIDTAGKGLRRSIPKGFPYFHVSWQGGGFVHVIEEEGDFPAGFGIDICAGMMGLPPGRFDKKGSKRKSFDSERQSVLEFLKAWEPYDWTQHMDAAGSGGGASSSAT